MSKIKNIAPNGVVSQILDWTYNKAINGLSGVDSAYRLGDDYLKETGSLGEQVDKMIKWQMSKAASSGFFTGLGGWALMPFTFPANIASVIYIQVRMISAIAYMGGHDIQSDKVKSLIFVCMLGNGSKEIFKDMGIKAGKKFVKNAIENSSKKAAQSITEKVSISLASKFGGKGLTNFSKALPVIGGVIGASFDASSTYIIGKIAKKIFIDNNNSISNLERDEIVIPAIV